MALSNTLVFSVTRREPELIVPQKPTPIEIKPLSDIDDHDGLRFLVPYLFFYSSATTGEDPVHIIRQVLGKALVFYYPLAGRIIEGADRKLLVNCNSQGVLFVEADANVKLDQLGDQIFPPCPYMDEFLCTIPRSGGIIGSPILYFQVTRFLCGGFSLGIHLNHTIADGYGLILFLNTIAELLKGYSTPSIPPVWQRELLYARTPPRVTQTHFEFDNLTSKTKSKEINQEKLVRTSILFGPKEIYSLQNQAQNQHGTKFELIVACLWKCRTIALELDRNDTVRFTVLINVRNKKKFGMKFPSGYYGNAFVYSAAVSKVGTLSNNPLSYAVDLIQEAKNRPDKEYVKSTIDYMVVKGRPMYGTPLNFLVSEITGLGFDELDLGWGKPLYGGVPWATSDISFASNLKNNEGEDGVIVSICLPFLALEKFKYELRKMICTEPRSKI